MRGPKAASVAACTRVDSRGDRIRHPLACALRRRVRARARRARCALRRRVLRRHHDDAHLLSPRLPVAHLLSKPPPILRIGSSRRGRRLSPLSALSPRARAGMRSRRCYSAPRDRCRAPDRGRRAQRQERRRPRAQPRRQRTTSSSRGRAGARRLSDRVGADASTVTRQAPARGHESLGHSHRIRERISKSASIQRCLSRAVSNAAQQADTRAALVE